MTDAVAVQVDEVVVTDEQRAAVIVLVTESPGVGIAKALRDVGVQGTRGQLRAFVESDEELAESLHEARGSKLRDELMVRAVDGVEEPIIGKDGDIVGHRVVKSDRLLEFACRMYLPEARVLRGVEVTGKDGGPLEVANSDVAAAIDRFTSNVRRLVERAQSGGAVRAADGGRAELVAGEPGD